MEEIGEFGQDDLIEEDVELVFGLEILQTLETEALKRTISDHSTQKLEICHKLLQFDSLKYFNSKKTVSNNT